MNQRLIVLVFLLSLIGTSISAQYGVRAKYNMNSFTGWNNYLDGAPQPIEDIFSSNFEVGVDYWFRLKNKRVEFTPELLYGLQTKTEASSLTYFGFNWNTSFYVFDLSGDCDCPTFSKQGPSIQKGFFINIAPGVLYSLRNVSNEVTELSLDNQQINFRLGVGVGFDIGISDLLTISPMVSYNISPSHQFNELTFHRNPSSSSIDEVNSGLNQIQFSLRFGFRPDYVKSYGRR